MQPDGERHPNSQRFHDLLREIGELHDRKQADYGSDTDPFANVRASERWGIPGWVGALVRLNDKVARLQSFARKGVLANESAEDSMLDIAVYALIAKVLYEEESAKSEEPTQKVIPPIDAEEPRYAFGSLEEALGQPHYHTIPAHVASVIVGERTNANQGGVESMPEVSYSSDEQIRSPLPMHDWSHSESEGCYHYHTEGLVGGPAYPTTPASGHSIPHVHKRP